MWIPTSKEMPPVEETVPTKVNDAREVSSQVKSLTWDGMAWLFAKKVVMDSTPQQWWKEPNMFDKCH